MARYIDEKDIVTPEWKLRTKDASVNISGLNKQLVRYLKIIPRKFQNLIVVTSGNDSDSHGKNSRHYKNDAVDLSLNPDTIGGTSNESLVNEFFEYIKNDPNRLALGITLLDKEHGTAPHIHLSIGNGTENRSDILYDPYSKAAKDYIEKNKSKLYGDVLRDYTKGNDWSNSSSSNNSSVGADSENSVPNTNTNTNTNTNSQWGYDIYQEYNERLLQQNEEQNRFTQKMMEELAAQREELNQKLENEKKIQAIQQQKAQEIAKGIQTQNQILSMIDTIDLKPVKRQKRVFAEGGQLSTVDLSPVKSYNNMLLRSLESELGTYENNITTLEKQIKSIDSQMDKIISSTNRPSVSILPPPMNINGQASEPNTSNSSNTVKPSEGKDTFDYSKYQGKLTKEQIDKIIKHYSKGTPVITADDVIKVSTKYGVPVELILAQGINESNLGTNGRRPKMTKNIFNIGNVDNGNNRYFNSWFDGLDEFGKLMSTEYKVKGYEDITRLVNNNFMRHKPGDNYASDPNYGRKIGNTIQSFYKKFADGGETNPPTSAVSINQVGDVVEYFDENGNPVIVSPYEIVVKGNKHNYKSVWGLNDKGNRNYYSPFARKVMQNTTDLITGKNKSDASTSTKKQGNLPLAYINDKGELVEVKPKRDSKGRVIIETDESQNPKLPFRKLTQADRDSYNSKYSVFGQTKQWARDQWYKPDEIREAYVNSPQFIKDYKDIANQIREESYGYPLPSDASDVFYFHPDVVERRNELTKLKSNLAHMDWLLASYNPDKKKKLGYDLLQFAPGMGIYDGGHRLDDGVTHDYPWVEVPKGVISLLSEIPFLKAAKARNATKVFSSISSVPNVVSTANNGLKVGRWIDNVSDTKGALESIGEVTAGPTELETINNTIRKIRMGM